MHSFTILIAGLGFVLISATVSNASPFELKMVGSSGGGGGGSRGSGGSGGGGGGFGSAGPWGSMKPATLGKESSLQSVRSAAQDTTALDQVITDSMVSVPSGGAPPATGPAGGDLTGASPVGTTGNSSTAPIATLDLGGGNQLPVSPDVARSIQDTVSQPTSGESPVASGGSTPASSAPASDAAGNNVGGSNTANEGGVGNDLPAVGSVLPLLLEDVVTYPGQSGPGISAFETDSVEASMPEPASLLLLATGLAVAGMRMRRKI